MKLLIVSHVIHYEHKGRVYAYGPYAREIELWADVFSEVRIASPVRREEPPKDCVPFAASNITMVPQLETGGDSALAKMRQMLSLPVHVWKLARAMSEADAIHVRCPGNLGLIGVILAPLFSRRIVAKYAGQWSGAARVPLSYRWQRRILASRWWRRGVVTVYGEWPNQPPQVVPFFTSMMSREQVNRAARCAAGKTLTHPAQVLYSGRLAPGKGVDVLIRAAGLVSPPVEVTIVGDGPERPTLEQLARDVDAEGKVRFAGAVSYDEVMAWYEKAHVLVLASNTEGWPKVLPEAMCHGVVCIGSTEGLIPWMLESRGATVPAGDAAALATAITVMVSDPVRYRELSARSAEWAQRYSMEDLKESLRRLLAKSWASPILAGEVSNAKQPAI